MNNKRPYYIPESKWIEDLPSYILEAAYQYLPLARFGFYETYRDGQGLLILNSEWGRVRFSATWEQHPYNHYDGKYELSIYYGRLHAPNQDVGMKWQGEICECWLATWHYMFEFIDHAFPNQSRVSDNDIFDEFRKKSKEFPNGIHWRLAYTAEVWKYYTPQLFELFDLRRPELWEQYRDWLKARYIAEGRSEAEDEKKVLIPYYRVC